MAIRTSKSPAKPRKSGSAKSSTTAELDQSTDESRDQEGIRQETISRLRTSKYQCMDEDYQQGRVLGLKWAQEYAHASELQRLEAFRSELEARMYGDDWDSFFDDPVYAVYGVDERLFFTIHPEDDKDRVAAREFWEGTVGDAILKATYPGSLLKGFAEAALVVWKSVQDEL